MGRVPARLRRPPPPPVETSGVDRALDYAAQVVAGTINVCELVRLSCARFLDDLAHAKAGDGDWEFRRDLAEAPMLFASLMPNIKGPLAGQPLRLMDWQCFVFANIFGFYERGTDARRFRQAVIYVPRGNGKTTIAAPIALYMAFCEGEGGAEGYAAAVTRDQARIMFNTASAMVGKSPQLRAEFGVDKKANAIYQEQTNSTLRPVSSDAKALDGLNVHVAVCDEIASHKTSEVYDVLLTAMGKRKHPLLLSISTTTGNTTGIGKQLYDYSVRCLRGLQDDQRLFSVIYTVDDADDPWVEATWVKANPSWGVSVMPDAIRGIMKQARNNPAQEAVAMTRHLNVWVGADEALFSMRAWRQCADPGLTLDDFVGQDCHMAIDLASKTDLASKVLIFPTTTRAGALVYRVFAKNYLNEVAVKEARNASYPGWAQSGHLTVTEGNETDFETIETDVLEDCARFNVVSMAYDPWAATQFAQRLTSQGVPCVEFRAHTQNFSEPTKELEAAIRAGRLHHAGDPVLEWCIGNVVGRYDARTNVYPKKSRPEQKIDAAIATIMGVARCLVQKPVEISYNRPEGRNLEIL